MILKINKWKEIRKKAYKSMEELADACGVSASQIKNYESNRRSVKEDDLKKMIKAIEGKLNIELSLNDFLKRDTKTIAVLNHKGGVGKTTVSSNLGYVLATELGKRTVLVDVDFQKNLTQSFGYNEDKEENFYNVFVNKESLSKNMIETGYKNLTIVPSCEEVATLEKYAGQTKFSESILKIALKEDIEEGKFDFIIYDCPPALNDVNTSVINSCDYILVVLTPASFDANGLEILLRFIDDVKEVNGNLDILGCVFNKVDKRKSITFDIMDMIKEIMGEMLFKNHISIDTNVEQAQYNGKPLGAFYSNTRAYKQFIDLAKEVVRNV